MSMTNSPIKLILDAPGERLDRALSAALPRFSRTQLQQLISDGKVTLKGKIVRSSLRLEGGEEVIVWIPDLVDSDIKPEVIPLDIRYEDDDFIVVNKPAGMVVHPAPGHETGTLVNAVMAHCPDLQGVGGEKRPGIVHRLDKETSGLMVVAKNDVALRHLQRQFKERSVLKEYTALIHGNFIHNEVLIDAAIGRDPKNRKRMAIIHPGTSAASRPAQTIVTLIKPLKEYSLVTCQPLTGRTHQIRVHLAFAGYPIVGDKIYGRRKEELDLARQFLHASKLTIKRPSDSEKISFIAELPPDLQYFLDKVDSQFG